jgi:hypothetical protein
MPDPHPETASSASPSLGAGYRERLTPSIGTWTVVGALGAILGILLMPLSVPLSLGVALVLAVLAVVLTGVLSPVVRVDDGHLGLGRARIDVDLLGEPEVLSDEPWEISMSTGFEPLAYHLTRGWIHAGVRCEVRDEEDPTTAWVVSSRDPEGLALAIRAAQLG